MTLSRWWTFRDRLISSDLDEPAVYELSDSSGATIYIGSSPALRTRLKEHLADAASTCIGKNAAKYRFEYTLDYRNRERELYDEFVRANGKPPQWNDVRPSEPNQDVRTPRR